MTRAPTKKEARNIIGYCEGHHILPKSFKLGGEKDKRNIAYLTAKEHIIVHRLMCRFSKSNYRTSSLRAFHCMVFKDNGGKNKRNPSTRQQSEAREYASIANSGKRGMIGAPKWSNCVTLEEFKHMLETLIASNVSDPKLAEMFNVSHTAIWNWKKKLNLNNRRNCLRDKIWLEKQYVHNKLSAREISEIIGCTGTAVQYYLAKFKIAVRSATDRQKNKHLIPEMRS